MSDEQKTKHDFDIVAFAEPLAKVEFEQWKHWAGEILQQEQISEERAERWRKIMATEWDDLPDEIKLKDYHWASNTLDAFGEDIFVSLVLIAEYLIAKLGPEFLFGEDVKGQFVTNLTEMIAAIKSEMQEEVE